LTLSSCFSIHTTDLAVRSDVDEGKISPIAKIHDVLAGDTEKLGHLTCAEKILSLGLVNECFERSPHVGNRTINAINPT
jgi:hypothetical protein